MKVEIGDVIEVGSRHANMQRYTSFIGELAIVREDHGDYVRVDFIRMPKARVDFDQRWGIMKDDCLPTTNRRGSQLLKR